jgi:hypothetical protein
MHVCPDFRERSVRNRRLQSPDLIWLIAAALLVLLQIWWLPGESGSASDSYSASIDGKLGLYRTLNRLFPSVRRLATGIVPPHAATLVLLAPERFPGQREQDRLGEFVRDGGNLMFAPGLANLAGSESTGDLEIPSLQIRISRDLSVSGDVTTAPQDIVQPPESPAVSSASKDSDTPEVEPAAEQAADDISQRSANAQWPAWLRTDIRVHIPDPATALVLLQSDDGRVEAASWTVGRGRVVVCSSAELFSNRSLLFPESRLQAIRLVEHCAAGATDRGDGLGDARTRAIVVSEYFNASDSYRDTGVLVSPALRSGTLQLLLSAMLAVWMAFHRLGPAVDNNLHRRRSLCESAEAVGNLQFHLQDGGAVVRSYLDYLRSSLRRHLGSAVRLENSEDLARRTGMPQQEIREQMEAAQRLAHTSGVAPGQAADTIRWLTELRRKLLAGTRKSGT